MALYEQHFAPSNLLMWTFLIRYATSQLSSYPIALKRLGGTHSKPNHISKI